MKLKIILPVLAACLLLTLLRTPSKIKPARANTALGGTTLELYDASSGTIPQTPLMNFLDFPTGSAPPSFQGGATVLDTTALNSIYAGWFSEGTTTPGFPILDRANGFQVDVTVQIESETHANNDRAGYSIIVLGSDAKGIELAFWENEIWAQNDTATGGLFTHGEGAVITTTTGLTGYQVIILGDIYTLTANTTPILTGPVRDYTDFAGFPDPYETPNLLFMGDDTSSARARIRLTHVSITGTGLPTSTPTSTLPPTPTNTPIPPTITPTLPPDITPTPTATPVEFNHFTYLPLIARGNP